MSFNFDSLKYSYSSGRRVVYGNKAMVCSSQPLAANAGVDIIKKGGNAIDAAIAAAACLTVVEPVSNGLGGDAFAIVWHKGKLYGLNASGPAPELISAEKIKDIGHESMPELGLIPVNVPGCTSAWAALSERFGKIPFEDILSPAIDYARNGYPVSPTISIQWKNGYENMVKNAKGDEFKYWFEMFAPNGRAPYAGEIWKSETMAKTLEVMAKTKCEAIYRGEYADAIDDFSKKYGGFIRKSDMEKYYPEWVEPISINYKGYDVWEIPPNGHGIVALMALNILKHAEIKHPYTIDTVHKQLEAMKMAFADGQKYISELKYMDVNVNELLSPKYALSRFSEISDTAKEPVFGNPKCGGTVYLCTADGEGNMVSYIQSNYTGFGSGIVIPETGISLHNRGLNFSLDKSSVNCVKGGKKPYHTIIPGFLTKDGNAVGPFGVMGGFMQPQGHVQVVMNMVDFGMNPQEALDAPRWQWTGGMDIEVERSFPYSITEELLRKGHNIKVAPTSIDFGRGQIIIRDDKGVLSAGSEPRADGCASAW